MSVENEEKLVLIGGGPTIFGGFNRTVYVVLLGIFTALTTVATIILIVPFPSTAGYFNLGDAFVMLSGLLLGPIGGFIAGGVGSAMGDVALGYMQYAPITFVAKGFEGLMVGLFSYKLRTSKKVSIWDIIGIILGAIMMLSGYYLGEILLLGYAPEAAFAELVLVNSIQVIVGGLITILIGPKIRNYLKSVLGTE
ncbi:MAG: ECF transporter S component [Candidatus Thorarchaeota archaeon]